MIICWKILHQLKHRVLLYIYIKKKQTRVNFDINVFPRRRSISINTQTLQFSIDFHYRYDVLKNVPLPIHSDIVHIRLRSTYNPFNRTVFEKNCLRAVKYTTYIIILSLLFLFFFFYNLPNLSFLSVSSGNFFNCIYRVVPRNRLEHLTVTQRFKCFLRTIILSYY